MSNVTVTVHRVPESTNVERVALAAALKGIAVDWVDHDLDDRSALVALSGQELVPVMQERDGQVTTDSVAIMARLEELVPEPALWPSLPAARAQADIFVAWFNRVWKVAPNVITDAEEAADGTDTTALVAELRGSRDLFEALLTDQDHLLSGDLTIADVVAFPFLKYAIGVDDDDPHHFHRVLHRELQAGTGTHPALVAWITRMDALPRA